MKSKLILLLLFSVSLSLYSQSLEIPFITNPEAVVTKSFYTLQYNERFEQADWVAYELTRNEVLGQIKRDDQFRSDSEVKTGSATLSDYRGSGFDRGHLAPAADMKFSSTAMSESFYLSNMSPQNPSFNRGIWSKLESYVRTWAYDNESVFVVTGAVLTKNVYPTIGENKVAVPQFYYKVILDYTEPELKGIGFILPNQKISTPLENYAISIDEVETFTGIDFFPLLPDDIEEVLESNFNTSLWSFKKFIQSNYISVNPVENNSNIETEGAVLYWINSSSNTRHNPSCRYYGNSKKGYYTTEPVGKACGLCGG